MSANFITIFRLLLTFVVIALLGRHRLVDIACMATIALIFALDAVDGVIARNRNETSAFGAVLDTVADRIVENTFWNIFRRERAYPLLVSCHRDVPRVPDRRCAGHPPLTRSLAIGCSRPQNRKENAAGFGEPDYGSGARPQNGARQNTLMNANWACTLTRSRTSRALYGVTKMFTFLYLGSLIVYRHSNPSAELGIPLVRVSVLLAAFTAALCLIRGIPVLVGG